jgi:hypothetical protein
VSEREREREREREGGRERGGERETEILFHIIASPAPSGALTLNLAEHGFCLKYSASVEARVRGGGRGEGGAAVAAAGHAPCVAPTSCEAALRHRSQL